jgi:hypothetical protein
VESGVRKEVESRKAPPGLGAESGAVKEEDVEARFRSSLEVVDFLVGKQELSFLDRRALDGSHEGEGKESLERHHHRL